MSGTPIPVCMSSDELLRSLVQASEDVVRVLDPAGCVTFVNDRGQELLGIVDFEKVRGAYWPEMWPEAARPDLERALNAALSGAVGRFEGRCPTADEDVDKWWDTVVTPVFDDGGAVIRALAISRDVTDQRKVQEALVAALADAEAANRARSDFFANVSHELRTPLNSIVGMGSLLEQSALTRDQQPMVEVIRESGEILARRLEDLLDHVRIDAGRLHVISAPFHLGDALRASAEAATAAGPGRNDFSVQIHASADVMVVGDEPRLMKIVSHLLGNALKFTDGGSVTLAAAAIDEGRYRITVADTGIGIHPDCQDQIFRQGDSSNTRVHGGLGLGLALSRQLAGLLGAELDCESAPDEGATFVLTIPLARHEAPCAPAPAQFSALIVDDHAANRQILQLVLGQAGVETVAAEHGAEACALFEKGRFDLVVMDIQMPVMDGLNAIRRMRGMEAAQKRPRTPVVVFTANATEENRTACRAADIDGFLTKPLQPVVLLSTFREVLARGRAAGGLAGTAS